MVGVVSTLSNDDGTEIEFIIDTESTVAILPQGEKTVTKQIEISHEQY